MQSAILLAPPAVVSGLFFPWGLERAAESLSENIFWDALGAGCGFFSFVLVEQAYGNRLAFAMTAVCYLAAAVVAQFLF